jgi:hypothetical protein
MTGPFVNVCCVFAILASSSAFAQELRYQMSPESKLSYRFEIVVDGDDETITYKGMTHYTAQASNDNQVQLTYRGGLSESKHYKNTNMPGGPFGRGFRPPSFPSPFSQPRFAGIGMTTNQITMSTRGEVLTMTGESQLPYLLGNVSLLPFEALPENENDSWSVDSGVAITKNESNDRFGNRFGPFGGNPFGGDANQQKNVSAAAELTQYQIVDRQSDLLSVRKNYQLTMPPTDKNQTFAMTGEGTWTFDRSDNMPASSDMQYKLSITSGNTNVIVPIKVKFDRVPQEEVQRIEAEAKRVAEERLLAAKQAKEEAERPLTADQISDAISALNSGNNATIKAQLEQLTKKTLKEPHPEVADAIQSHLDSDDKTIHTAAHKALLSWSPAYKKIHDLERAYSGPGVVDSSKLEVNSLTRLYVGQILQVQEHGHFWHPAEITQLKDDGQVVVQLRGGGRRTITVARRNLQLAPNELPQPNQPTSASVSAEASRSWSDKTGKFKIEAVLLRLENGEAVLKRTDGREISVPANKLSPDDQEFLKKWEAETAAAENPFE